MSDWRSLVEEIRSDSRSGATALLRRAAVALELAVEAAEAEGRALRGELRQAARAVASVRPAMGAMCRLASVALAALDKAATDTDAAARVRAALGRFTRRVERDAPWIAARASGLLQEREVVVTISASSLVERTLVAAAAKGRTAVAVCLESRPALEGVPLAARLAAAGLEVTVVSDAAGARVVARAQLVLVGADTLSPSGVIHKMGTLGLALAARHYGVPIHALCGQEKWLPAPLLGALADAGPPGELLPDSAPGLEADNRYFDQTPLELIDGVVGPRHIYPGAAVAALTRRVAIHPALADLLEPTQE